MTPILTKSYKAEAAVAGRRIVKFGTADDQVLQGAAATDLLVGVAERVGAAIGKQVDVIHAGVAELDAGGTITRGALVTSDASGKGVAAAPAGGVNNHVIGFALVGADDGDLFPVLVVPHRVQGQV